MPASASPRATNGHANRGTVGVTPAVTRSRAANLLSVPVATRYVGSRDNDRTISWRGKCPSHLRHT